MLLGVASAANAQSASGQGDELILDPELAAVASAPSPSEPPTESNGQVNVSLHSRLGMDLQWQDPREDIWEATQIALLETRVRRSEDLSFALGLRARHVFAARAHATRDADAERFELDIAPTAGYADIGLSDAWHLRAGYQSVQLGRFDVLNPSDLLSTRDLRSGPTTMPLAGEIAQLALRLDWDALRWLSLRAVALPFFLPHRVHFLDGDYALSISRQDDVDAAYEAAYEDPADGRRLQRLLRSTLSRSGQAQLGQGALSAFAPEPSFTSPQAALRMLAHGPSGELGLTLGTALEHLPALDFSNAFLTYIDQDPGDPEQETAALLADKSPIEVRYGRFFLLSMDAATALGPLQLGAEVAYIVNRTLFSAQTGTLPLAEQNDMLHGGVRLEYAQSEHFLVAIEACGDRALTAPDQAERRFMFLTQDRLFLAAVGLLAFSPSDIGLTLELSGGVLNGPSYLIGPRVEQALTEGLYAEAGVLLIGGKAVPTFGDPGLALGGLYDGVDQVFIGLRLAR